MTAPGSILRKFQKVAVVTAAIVATAISPASLANAKGGHGGGGAGIGGVVSAGWSQWLLPSVFPLSGSPGSS